jgi:hypothetical protein
MPVLTAPSNVRTGSPCKEFVMMARLMGIFLQKRKKRFVKIYWTACITETGLLNLMQGTLMLFYNVGML